MVISLYILINILLTIGVVGFMLNRDNTPLDDIGVGYVILYTILIGLPILICMIPSVILDSIFKE